MAVTTLVVRHSAVKNAMIWLVHEQGQPNMATQEFLKLFEEHFKCKVNRPDGDFITENYTVEFAHQNDRLLFLLRWL